MGLKGVFERGSELPPREMTECGVLALQDPWGRPFSLSLSRHATDNYLVAFYE